MSDEVNKPRGMRASGDFRVSEIARRQFGVASTADLEAAGFDRHAIARRVAAGRLHPLFTGAFAVGHRSLTREGWFMAALLSYGCDAVLSHFSAAMVHGIWKYRVKEIHLKLPRTAGIGR